MPRGNHGSKVSVHDSDRGSWIVIAAGESRSTLVEDIRQVIASGDYYKKSSHTTPVEVSHSNGRLNVVAEGGDPSALVSDIDSALERAEATSLAAE